MNNGSVWRGIFIALLVVGVAAAIGAGAYNAGVAHGIAESGRIAAAPPGSGAPYVVNPYGWHRPWGFGFPFFPFFGILFAFLILRGLWWRGPWGYGRPGCGYGYYGPPPADRRPDEAHSRS